MYNLDFLSTSSKKAISNGLMIPRLLTSQIRVMPNFIIIGAPRCGTTSLYNYLIKHPCVKPPFTKEIHFFDFNYDKGVNWYRAYFPIKFQRFARKKFHNCKSITGEASPYYIFHPHVPKRIFELIPDVKLIALLRNPIERAYSHYNRNVKRSVEKLSFEDAIKKENIRLNGELEKIYTDEKYYSLNLHKYSYLTQGIYIDQLKNWFETFKDEQILILKSEDFYESPKKTLYQVLDYLHLPPWNLKEYKKYNYQSYSDMDINTRKKLVKFFTPHNRKLYNYLGIDLDWE